MSEFWVGAIFSLVFCCVFPPPHLIRRGSARRDTERLQGQVKAKDESLALKNADIRSLNQIIVERTSHIDAVERKLIATQELLERARAYSSDLVACLEQGPDEPQFADDEVPF